MSKNEFENVSVNARRRSRDGNNLARMNRARTLIGISSALLAAILIFAGVAIRVRAQGQGGETAEMVAYRAAMEDADQKILAEEQAHSELMKNLEHLTTQIGPRLTGSKQMQDASAWTLKRFQDYGIDAHLETTQVPHAWMRGADTAEITAPIVAANRNPLGGLEQSYQRRGHRKCCVAGNAVGGSDCRGRREVEGRDCDGRKARECLAGWTES